MTETEIALRRVLRHIIAAWEKVPDGQMTAQRMAEIRAANMAVAVAEARDVLER